MKQTYIVWAILIFGVLMAISSPHLISMALENDDATYETDKTVTTKAEYNSDLATAVPEANEKIEVVEEVKEEVSEEIEPLEEEKNIPTKEVLMEPIVYDGLTLNELTDKFNRVLKSNLSGTGYYFAKYATDSGVDPYIAVAISLHETGCNWNCSNAVRSYNNVGGMYSGGSLIKFSTLEEGIKAYINNLKVNYYDKGLTTLEQIHTKYASSPTWVSKVSNYISKIKAA